MLRRQAVPALLQRLRLGHGEVTVESTPRRLAAIVRSLDAAQADVEERVRGPPAKVTCSSCYCLRHRTSSCLQRDDTPVCGSTMSIDDQR